MEKPATPDSQPAAEETIFSQDEFVPGQYDKYIRQARNALFIVAAVQFLFGAFLTYQSNEEPIVAWIGFAVVAFVSALFFGLGLYTKKKPYTAILIGLILYISLLLLDVVTNPASIFKGIILKALIIFYLARSLGDAKEAQEGMKHMKGG
ncbi:MAG: hypothetical protein MUF62_01885 [Chitinophagaceae bacterium]|nr:hypothetical protein [Chitinophagaceae bacterium]